VHLNSGFSRKGSIVGKWKIVHCSSCAKNDSGMLVVCKANDYGDMCWKQHLFIPWSYLRFSRFRWSSSANSSNIWENVCCEALHHIHRCYRNFKNVQKLQFPPSSAYFCDGMRWRIIFLSLRNRLPTELRRPNQESLTIWSSKHHWQLITSLDCCRSRALSRDVFRNCWVVYLVSCDTASFATDGIMSCSELGKSRIEGVSNLGESRGTLSRCLRPGPLLDRQRKFSWGCLILRKHFQTNRHGARVKERDARTSIYCRQFCETPLSKWSWIRPSC